MVVYEVVAYERSGRYERVDCNNNNNYINNNIFIYYILL